MKKLCTMMLALMILIFSGQAKAADFEVDYGDSKIFTKSEMDSAIAKIDETLTGWGHTLLRVRYVGDEISNSKENIKYMNHQAKAYNFKKKFTKCMVFETDFMTSKDPHDGKVTALEYDREYKGYGWHFGFYEEDGEWKLLAWGYC